MSTPVAEKPTNRFIDPKVLVKIQNLELVARTVVEGFVQGLHRSPYLGFSVDFAEYRQYMPGDEIRRIDWNVFSRSDRLYVKLYEGETNTRVLVLLGIQAYLQGRDRWAAASIVAATAIKLTPIFFVAWLLRMTVSAAASASRPSSAGAG